MHSYTVRLYSYYSNSFIFADFASLIESFRGIGLSYLIASVGVGTARAIGSAPAMTPCLCDLLPWRIKRRQHSTSGKTECAGVEII